MKLVVGLGNPGEKYENSRHNVGFRLIDESVTRDTRYEKRTPSKIKKLVTCYVSPVTDVLLAKPQTFMNESGRAVKTLVNFYKVSLDNLWVIHDDLDIKLGEHKIQKGRGPKVHNGVNSVEEALGSKDFWRVRIGIENRISGYRDIGISGEKYVLEDFNPEELTTFSPVIDKIIQELKYQT